MKASMTGRIITYTGSLLLSGVLLLGTAGSIFAQSETDSYYEFKEHADLNYEDMVYTSVDPHALDDALAELDAVTDGTASVDDPEQRTAELYDEILQITDREYTNYVLGDIEHYRHVNDEELSELNRQDTLALQDMSDAALISLQKALAGSYGSLLQEEFSDDQLNDIEEYQALTDRERELIDKDTELQQTYDRLSEEDYSFEYKGREWTLDDLMEDSPEEYEDITEVYLGVTREMNKVMAPLFLEMISNRKEIAEEEGYDTYTDYCYDVVYGRDFTGEDIAALRETVIQELKPLYEELQMMQYMHEFNMELDEPLSGDEIVDTLAEHIGNVHPELEEAFGYLREHNLYCIDNTDDMVDVGFTSDLPEYGSAFIYDKTSGTIHDLETIVHEFGHFNAEYHANSNSLMDTLLVDVAEIQSQGLEMLFLDEMQKILPDDPEGLELFLLTNMLDSILTGFEYDEFQQEVYSRDDMTVEELNRLAMDIDNKYTQYFYDDDGKAYEWVMVNHTFTSPLYYIGYATSALSALDIWTQSLEDRDSAVDKYMKISAVPLDMPYEEAVTSCGLRNMLEPESIRELAEEIRVWADENLTGGMDWMGFPEFDLPFEFGENGPFGFENPVIPVEPYENGTVPYEYEPEPYEYDDGSYEDDSYDNENYEEDSYYQDDAYDLAEDIGREAMRVGSIVTGFNGITRIVVLIIALIAFFRKKKRNRDNFGGPGGWNGPSGPNGWNNPSGPGTWNGPSGPGDWNSPTGPGTWSDPSGPDDWDDWNNGNGWR